MTKAETLSRLRRPVMRGQFFWSLAVVMLVSFSLAGIGIALSNARAREGERKFCTVVAQSKRTEYGKLAEYEQSPPQTDAGIAQRDQLRISYSNYLDLERQLGCPPEREEK